MEQAENALRRMVCGAGGSGEAQLPALLADALAAALPRAARRAFDCAGALEEATRSEMPAERMLAAVPDPALIVLLGPAPERPVGLLWLAPLLVNGLVELATAAPDSEVYRIERPPTETDAALCRGFCETLLAELREALPEGLRQALPEPGWLGHFRAAPPLALRLSGGGFACAGGTVALQGGLRGGALGLVLEAGLLRVDAPAAGAADPAFAARLQDRLQGVPLALRADLARIRVPLARALALCEGEVLELPAASLAEVTLSGAGGPPLLRGCLGQEAGMKVLSLSGPAPGVSWPAVADAPAPEPAGAAPPAAVAEAGAAAAAAAGARAASETVVPAEAGVAPPEGGSGAPGG